MPPLSQSIAPDGVHVLEHYLRCVSQGHVLRTRRSSQSVIWRVRKDSPGSRPRRGENEVQTIAETGGGSRSSHGGSLSLIGAIAQPHGRRRCCLLPNASETMLARWGCFYEPSWLHQPSLRYRLAKTLVASSR